MTTIDQAILINPKVSIKRGDKVPFVSMDQIRPGIRSVVAVDNRTFTSGSKFEPGDVLMARITPCLENGKIARYEGFDVAAGSTEFIVVRGKPGVTITNYLYYWLWSPRIRELAISNMAGTSGRQRVRTDAFTAEEYDFPSLTEQRAIADVLGALDDKIAANQRVISDAAELCEAHVQLS